ncbi:TRAP transporter substrate-binding protein DctP [Ruegeria sp. SCP11]|uniref:TRAP transporter substrate-binding protein DctP n=1 Tax=Ruegeria sp. SCP11 TaxID=3141378 RepID=UPI003336C19A
MNKVIKSALCASVLALGLGAVSAPVQAANVDGPAVFWKFSVWGKSRSLTRGVEKLSERLAEETGGKFQLKIFYGEQLSKTKENLDSMKVNSIEGALVCNFYHPGKTPTLMVMSLPFLPLTDFDSAARAREALYAHPDSVAEMAEWNAIIYGSTHVPQNEFLGRGRTPQTLEDWKGLRVRAGGGIGIAMEELGAVRQAMPATEVYTALQRKTVDAVAFPFSYAHAAYKLHEVADWFTSNLTPGTADCPIILNKTAYEALPQQYKDLLDSLKDEVADVYRGVYTAADEKYLPVFREELTEIEYSEADLAEFRATVGQPIWDKWVADNKGTFDAQSVLDQILAAAAEN